MTGINYNGEILFRGKVIGFKDNFKAQNINLPESFMVREYSKEIANYVLKPEIYSYVFKTFLT